MPHPDIKDAPEDLIRIPQAICLDITASTYDRINFVHPALTKIIKTWTLLEVARFCLL